MGLSNLPPGVSEGDIPGNSPEDCEWDFFHEKVDGDTAEFGLEPAEAHICWLRGLLCVPRIVEDGQKCEGILQQIHEWEDMRLDEWER
jgi:hypothetical protein